LEFRTRSLHVTLDAVEVQRSTEHHVPLREMLRIPHLRNQGGAVTQHKAVIDVMATALAGLDQLAYRIDPVGVAVIVEALADPVPGVALENARRLAVIAPEVAILAVGHFFENGDRLVARLPVALHRTLMEWPDNPERQLDVMLEFSAAVLSQALSGLFFLLLGKLLQLVDSDTAKQDGQ